MVTFIEEVELSPSATGSWEDIDVSSYVNSGNTEAVVLYLDHNNSIFSSSSVGFRKNGSTDTLTSKENVNIGSIVTIGIDNNDVFEFYQEDDTFDLYLFGYYSESEATFNTNALDRTPSSDATWEDIDVSGDCSDTALAVCGVITASGGNPDVGVRKNGFTSDLYELIDQYVYGSFIMGVDENEIMEQKTSSSDSTTFSHFGYITDNLTSLSSVKDYTGGSTGWEVTDLSSDIPSGNRCSLLYPLQSSSYNFGLRENGDTFELWSVTWNVGISLQTDTNQKIEQKRHDPDTQDLFLWGYASEPSAGPSLPVVETLEPTNVQVT